MPPQFTTVSQAIAPSLVSTPVTAPSRVRTRLTVTFSSTRAPPARAPAASAWVTSAGITRPSSGTTMAPARSSTGHSGHRRCPSPGLTMCASMPHAEPMAT